MKKLKTFEDFNNDYDYANHRNRVSGAGAEAGSTELIDAVKHNDIVEVEDLIKLGANLDEQDSEGKSAIDHAGELSSNEIFNLLVDSGANVGYGHSSHSSKLHHQVLGN